MELRTIVDIFERKDRFTGAPWRVNQQARWPKHGLPACLRLAVVERDMEYRAMLHAASSSSGPSMAEPSTTTTVAPAVGSAASSSLLDELVPPAVKAGHYVVEASHDVPSFAAMSVPVMPTTSGARVKAAAPPMLPRSPERRSDAATGDFDFRPWESSRERQWRLYGVWRCRGGRRQDEFRRR